MNSRLYTLFVVCSILLANTLTAQPDSAKNKLQFKVGVFYNSNLHYYGRTDSMRSSGVFPLAELWLGDRFYINAAPVFINNAMSTMEYAGTIATTGYQARTKRSSIHVYLAKPIYRENSELLQSALKAQLAGSYTWLNKILNITAGLDAKWSDEVDIGATAGLDHLYRKDLKDGLVLLINPSAFLYAGTQRFSKTYYKKTEYLLLPDKEETITSNATSFNVLSIEFSAPVILAKGKWLLLFSPAYVMPKNLLSTPVATSAPERGKDMFYITTGVKYTF